MDAIGGGLLGTGISEARMLPFRFTLDSNFLPEHP